MLARALVHGTIFTAVREPLAGIVTPRFSVIMSSLSGDICERALRPS